VFRCLDKRIETRARRGMVGAVGSRVWGFTLGLLASRFDGSRTCVCKLSLSCVLPMSGLHEGIMGHHSYHPIGTM